jgi:alpha-L-rhamnosidase
VTALGCYELVINGVTVGDGLLRPGWTDSHRRVQYQVVDLGQHLRAGDNVVGAHLAPGWFAGKISSRAAVEDSSHPDVRTPELLVQLEMERHDGHRFVLGSDESWVWAPSAILSSDLYDGEDWDCRLLRAGWAGRDVTDTGPWHRVELSTGTSALLVGERGAPLRVIGVAPAHTTWRPDGSALLDSGCNDTGFLRLCVREAPGRRVEVSYGEVVDPAGNLYRANLRRARCQDTFICAGSGIEHLTPSFSYRGYRYAEVRGLSEEDSLVGADAVAIGSDMERTGRFRSSERLLEQMHEMMVCSLRANYVEVPTDCPQRDERLGWMADALLFAPVAAYTYDINPFISKWFDDVLDARTSEGGFSDIAPRPSARWSHRPTAGAPAWADAGVQLPWLIYERYGDRELLERAFPAMLTWLETRRRSVRRSVFECPLSASLQRALSHSARSTNAVGVRAANWPGSAATRLAKMSAPRPTRTTDQTGTVASGTASMLRAKRVQSWRPRMIPSGIPTMTPTTAVTVACHATTAASCRGAKPSAFKRARSRRRWRTDATSVRPSATIAPAASPPARMTGVAPMLL